MRGRILRRTVLAGAAIAGTLVGPAARADTYDFSYRLTTGNTVSGALYGSLQGDGNTVNLTGVQSLLINGIVVNEALTGIGTDAFYGQDSNRPSATVNANLLDFTIENTANSDYLIFGVRDLASDDLVGYDFVGGTASLGGDGKLHEFAPSRYAAEFGTQALPDSPSTSVPEPASLTLLAVAAALAAPLIRRRRAT